MRFVCALSILILLTATSTNVWAQPSVSAGSIVGIDVLFINLKNPPLDNVKVRKALALTVDARKIGTTVSAMLTEQRPLPATGLLFPGVPGFDEARQRTRNLDQAREILRESGIGDPSSVRPLVMFVLRARTEWRGAMADIAAEGLRGLGFTVVVQEVGDVGIVGTAARRGQGDFFLLAPVNVGRNTSPQGFYRSFLQNTLAPTGGANFFGYRNQQIDDLLARFQSAQGPSVGETLAKIEQILLDEVPYVPLLFLFTP